MQKPVFIKMLLWKPLKIFEIFLRFILTGQNGKLFNFYIPINEHAINILFMTIDTRCYFKEA